MSRIAWRLRRCANIRRRSEAKHCSLHCSQSEGERILWRPNTAKNPTKSCRRALAIFATCSWPSLCEQSELQCWRRNRRLCGAVQIPVRGRCCQYLIFYLEHPTFQGRWRLSTNLWFFRILNLLPAAGRSIDAFIITWVKKKPAIGKLWQAWMIDFQIQS